MCWLSDYFSRFVKNFLCYFFQKQAWKYHLTQGSVFKTAFLNEKQSNLRKEKYGNISLYSQYFSPGAGKCSQKCSQCSQNILLFFKTNKKVFCFIFLDQKIQYKIKKYIHVTHTTEWNVNFWRSKFFYLHFQRDDIKTIFSNNFSSKLDTFGNT